MAIEKPMIPSNVVEIMSGNESEEQVEVEIINPDAVSIEDEDGGMTIVLDPNMQEDIIGPDHMSNIAEFMDDADLESLGSELVHQFHSDRQSRSDWAKSYVKGLDLMGLKIEEKISRGREPAVFFTRYLLSL